MNIVYRPLSIFFIKGAKRKLNFFLWSRFLCTVKNIPLLRNQTESLLAESAIQALTVEKENLETALKVKNQELKTLRDERDVLTDELELLQSVERLFGQKLYTFEEALEAVTARNHWTTIHLQEVSVFHIAYIITWQQILIKLSNSRSKSLIESRSPRHFISPFYF